MTSSSSLTGSGSWRWSCSGSSRSRSPPATSRWSRIPAVWPICSIGSPASILQAIDLPQDVDRLGAQLPIEPLEVLLGELSRRMVGLGVADLPVLGRLARLEVGELGDRRIVRFSGGTVSQWSGHEPGDQHDDDQGEEELQLAGLGGGPQLPAEPCPI